MINVGDYYIAKQGLIKGSHVYFVQGEKYRCVGHGKTEVAEDVYVFECEPKMLTPERYKTYIPPSIAEDLFILEPVKDGLNKEIEYWASTIGVVLKIKE